MKYMALIYSAPNSGPARDTPEFGKFMGGYQAIGETYTNDGVFLAGEALQDVSSATSIRIRDGKMQTMDGPFAETKEQLGGFYLFECPDLDSAIKYAAMIPTANHGTVEVRPVIEINWD